MSTSYKHARPSKSEPHSGASISEKNHKNSSICHGALACYPPVPSAARGSNQTLMSTTEPSGCLVKDRVCHILCVNNSRAKTETQQRRQSVSQNFSSLSVIQTEAGHERIR